MLFACSRSADVFDIGSVDIVGVWVDEECSRWIKSTSTDAHQDTQVRSIT
jgi:hypothetical protein